MLELTFLFNFVVYVLINLQSWGRERVHRHNLDTKHLFIFMKLDKSSCKNINVLRIGSVCELLVDLVFCALLNVGRES